jgi:alginate O-acetyltransferase complex protein AlgI
MFGLASAGPAADAIAGVIYTPYHGFMFALAAVVVWAMPNTWEFTERLSGVRATLALAALLAALALMWTQTVNPFLYFQF